jgi:hypothetical protein
MHTMRVASAKSVAETIRDVAYDEALRSINAQAGVLDELRGRTATLLAAASLVTSFLGGVVLASPTLENGVVSRPPIGGWGWFAIGAFCAIGVLSLLIVWPYTWRFEMDPLAIATSAERAGLDDQGLKFNLIRFHQQNHNRNQWKIDGLFWAFRLACAALVLETLAWIIDLRG